MEDDRDKGPPVERMRRERVNIALAVLIVIAATIGAARWWGIHAARVRYDASPPAEAFYVEVTGAINDPGEYSVVQGNSLNELIIMAGGYAEGADLGKINPHLQLEPGMRKIDIPFRADIKPPEKPPRKEDAHFPININTASAFELQVLPGIGPVTAERIIDYREENGPFLKRSDLMKVYGIGEQTFGKLLGLITVGDKSPLE